MTANERPVRKVLRRVLATASMLAIYAVAGIATTGMVVGTWSGPAYAQGGQKRGRGGGGGGGGGRGRGRGRGNTGAGVAAGVAAGVGALIIGGAIEAQRRSEYEAAVRECQRTYGRRYILETHEFVGRDGGYYPCP